MQLQLAGWRRCVYPFIQTDELHADGSQLFEQNHQMPKVAPESIEAQRGSQDRPRGG